MDSQSNSEEFRKIVEVIESLHPSSGGPIYQNENCIRAFLDVNNDLEAIYDIVETHSPGLRNNTQFRYNKLLANKHNSYKNLSQLEVNMKNLAIKCATYPREKKITEMLEMVEEMPKEWTVVQLTPQFNPLELLNEDKNNYYTNSLYISIFSPGQLKKPFYVVADAPYDEINGQKIELCKEIMSILEHNKEVLTTHTQKSFKNIREKETYFEAIKSVEDRFQGLRRDIQNLWLKHWRCLLAGKFCDHNLEMELKQEIKTFFHTEALNLELTEKNEIILTSTVKNYSHLTLNEIKRLIQYCFPSQSDKNFIPSLINHLKNLWQKLLTGDIKPQRHPVILILHDSLDTFPWEMIDVLKNQPVSRVPSLHFLYCLFKEHEKEIVDGYKIIRNYEQGCYVVNPNEDLRTMEMRMISFFNYWTPNWTGISGYEPSKDEFLELLTTSRIFSYNGHGSGSHYLSTEKLQNSHVNAVVLLFGCGSTKIIRPDPQIDMYGHYYMYLIARCPCVVGMLWEVTDTATDVLSTDFMSYWIPSKASKHWKIVDKKKWRKGAAELSFLDNVQCLKDEPLWEPDLLGALNLAKKKSQSIITKASCVARGLPVKIVQL